MLYINEWLPNPVGNDATGEFIELYNSGTTGVSLNGYSLGDGATRIVQETGVDEDVGVEKRPHRSFASSRSNL